MVVLTLNTPTYGLVRPIRAVYGAATITASVRQNIPNVLNFYGILTFVDSFENLLSEIT